VFFKTLVLAALGASFFGCAALEVPMGIADISKRIEKEGKKAATTDLPERSPQELQAMMNGKRTRYSLFWQGAEEPQLLHRGVEFNDQYLSWNEKVGELQKTRQVKTSGVTRVRIERNLLSGFLWGVVAAVAVNVPLMLGGDWHNSKWWGTDAGKRTTIVMVIAPVLTIPLGMASFRDRDYQVEHGVSSF
jgi:hypothetical protein